MHCLPTSYLAVWGGGERQRLRLPWPPLRTAIGALRRLEQLIQEVVVTVPRALIAETIDLVAVLSGRGSERRLAELSAVTGLTPGGDYHLTETTQTLEGTTA